MIDTPGEYRRATAAAVAAADTVVIPVPRESEPVLVLDRPEQVVWYVPNKIAGTKLAQDALTVLNSRYPGHGTPSVRLVKSSASTSFVPGMPVSAWVPRDGISQDYQAATSPIIDGIQGT